MNKSPQVLFDRDVGSLSFFEEQLKDASERDIKSITFLIAGKYPHNEDEMTSFLKGMKLPVTGGIFPEVIYEGQHFTDAMLAILWFDEPQIHTFLNASDLNSPLHQQQEPIIKGSSLMTSLVFSNTKTRAAESALDALYYRSGQSMQYSGAGSTYLLGDETPSIVTNEGLVSDALQVALFPYQQKVSVGHGWSILSGPHLVTESEENKVKTLDYQAIKPYYESVIRTNLGDEVKDLTFEQMMNIFPIGIQPYDENMIVRATISYEDEQMQFVGDIPEFSSVYILAGEQEHLLDYVKSNADDFAERGNEEPNLSIIISCIGRRQHMAERSDEELSILSDSLGRGSQVVGMTSVGEIASNSTGLARLHSMTLVVANLWT